jgi:penicillin-binding protein 2
MLVFDQLKKDDAQLRFLAAVVLAGMLILLIGLWWVQVVSTRYYRDKLEVQSTRTVRMPAIRGKILDRNGSPLAENRPSYSIDLYLEELSHPFQSAFSRALARINADLNHQRDAREKQLGRKLTAAERKQFALPESTRNLLAQQTRYEVASNIVSQLSAHLGQLIELPQTNFDKWYARSRALPMPILSSLNPAIVARFEEQSASSPGVDLGVQSVRIYPHGNAAAHVLGYLSRTSDSNDDPHADIKYSYRLRDFEGMTGIEKLFDPELRGSPGSKSVLVNNYGYRQSESIWTESDPGQNVVLTVDLDIQTAAESALHEAQANVRGAVVVMDVRNGDVLAMASAPNYDPNHFTQFPDPKPWDNDRWADAQVGLQKNRAMQENYHPGSIFKIVTSLAALEQGVLDPNEVFHSDGYYRIPGRTKPIGDTAGAGEFNFNHAFAKSSNPYFINYGLKPGVLPRMIAIGQRLHLGEHTGLLPRQRETGGNFPGQKRMASPWYDGDTANLSIGQGEIDVTPLQMAIMTTAVANRGKVFHPRLVSRIEYNDGSGQVDNTPEGQVWDNLGVSERSLAILHAGMLADVEMADGSGRSAAVPGWRVAGKTGTAEVERHGHIDKSVKDTWFVCFAPADSPRYAVVAMVEGGLSGHLTCAPIAHKILLALQQREAKSAPKPVALLQSH